MVLAAGAGLPEACICSTVRRQRADATGSDRATQKPTMSGDGFTFDPMDEATRRDPYSLYSRARREYPVYAHQGLPLVSIFRYADVTRVFRDSQTWSNDFSIFIQPYLLG